jgi:hypothetical protein
MFQVCQGWACSHNGLANTNKGEVKVEEQLPNLNGKAVAIYLSGAEASFTFESPKFEKQGGRVFLVGVQVPFDENQPSWPFNGDVYLSWDKIAYYVVFNSLEEMRSAFARGAKTKNFVVQHDTGTERHKDFLARPWQGVIGILFFLLSLVLFILAPVTASSAPAGVLGIRFAAGLAAFVGFAFVCTWGRPITTRIAAGALCLAMVITCASIVLAGEGGGGAVAALLVALTSGFFSVTGKLPEPLSGLLEAKIGR